MNERLEPVKASVLRGVLALWLCASAALADPATVLERLFAGETTALDFSSRFLDAVPEARLTALVGALRDEIGPLLEVDVDGTDVRFLTATHRMTAQISLDPEGRIEGLLFQAPIPLEIALSAAETAMRALGDQVTWLARQNGTILAGNGAETRMAVGSAFKIAVARILSEDVASGARSWSDVVTLDETHSSLPSGVMQTWPVGAPVTLHTAALQMIALSDNTATEVLIDSLGRERIAARLGLAHMLTTREFFALKADPVAATRYLAASDADKARVAAEAVTDAWPPDMAALPHHVAGLEWDIGLAHLCDLMEPLADLDVMQVNSGLLDPRDWGPIAYKGGSEPGVLAFISVLPEAEGGPICLALAINHSATIDEASAAAAYRRFAVAVAAR